MKGIEAHIPQNLAKLEPAVREILSTVTVDVLMLCRFGSHLYGTDTPVSDTDYKGIFIPTKQMILMGEIPKSINNNTNKPKGQKNTSEDTDFELYSLHYFIEMACNGDTAAMDMLHVNDPNLLVTSGIWEKIVKDRASFYTKSLSAFVQYARRQAAKYGIKGSRLAVAKEVIAVIDSKVNDKARLSVVWGKLPINEHARHIPPNPNGIKQYQVCGKTLQESITLYYARCIMCMFVKQYGARAKQAETNKGIDWKAISHAIRAAYQIKEIYTKGTITFPLAKAEYLKKVKLGELDFATEVQPKLEQLITALDIYVDRSTLPEEVDREHWKGFVIKMINRCVVARSFPIDIAELRNAYDFAEAHGTEKHKSIMMRVEVGEMGTGFVVSANGHIKDITNIDNW